MDRTAVIRILLRRSGGSRALHAVVFAWPLEGKAVWMQNGVDLIGKSRSPIGVVPEHTGNW